MHKKQDYLLMLRDLNSFKEKWSLYTEKEFIKVFWKTGISQFLRFSKWHSVVIPKTWKRIKVLSKRVFAFENKRYSQIELETRTRVRIPVSVWNIYIYIYYLHCRGQFLRGIGSNSFTNFRRKIIGREAKFFDVREVGNIHKYYCLQIDISIKFHLIFEFKTRWIYLQRFWNHIKQPLSFWKCLCECFPHCCGWGY